VNSLTPSKFEEEGFVALRLIWDKDGVTPTTTFPKTSVILAEYLTIVEVLAVVNVAKFKL
jgi:hypothetical protein